MALRSHPCGTEIRFRADAPVWPPSQCFTPNTPAHEQIQPAARAAHGLLDHAVQRVASGRQVPVLPGGTLLTKTSEAGYTTPGAAEQKAAPDVEVLAEDDQPAPAARVAAKPDDVALISKALDALEAIAGKTPELAAARQALRRLDALAKLKTAG